MVRAELPCAPATKRIHSLHGPLPHSSTATMAAINNKVLTLIAVIFVHIGFAGGPQRQQRSHAWAATKRKANTAERRSTVSWVHSSLGRWLCLVARQRAWVAGHSSKGPHLERGRLTALIGRLSCGCPGTMYGHACSVRSSSCRTAAFSLICSTQAAHAALPQRTQAGQTLTASRQALPHQASARHPRTGHSRSSPAMQVNA